ncbi:glycosyltransferase family 2 protein [Methylocella sp. CPCC 101449]|uniref:glycosyltransferase family 2 protein n=1 Tax=Methylocella sp. CPCC 101449 TaxID=2987531 RepID=UPI0028901893|nr:glycosyltransferase family 2 protein [Methylocella sp. CPCC 101449]MDT2019460.1 glycosyltransferase family 2 protein [Methylocella sp. CPCC 101449]
MGATLGKMISPKLFSAARTIREDQVTLILEEYKSVEFEILSLSKMTRPQAPVVISVIKNELNIIAEFLSHYRELGVEKFAFIDNGSEDGTVEFLSSQDDVDLYKVIKPFSTLRKQAWINLLIKTYAENWIIYVDADEHIVFDDLRFEYKLPDLARFMDRLGVRRVRGCLVDMYGSFLIPEASGEPRALTEVCPFFDKSGYNEYQLLQFISREGGIRQRIFRDISAEFRPQLTKYPMFRLDDRELFTNPHYLWPYEPNFKSDCFLGILHFKFLPNFMSKTETAIIEGGYWKNSFEYRCYKELLVRDGNIPLCENITAVYEGPSSLTAHNIISPIFKD